MKSRLNIAVALLWVFAVSVSAETVAIPVPDVQLRVPAGFSCALGTASGATGLRKRLSGACVDELRIEIATPELRSEWQPWAAGEEFALDPAPAGGRRNWPDRRASFYQGFVNAGGLREARFAALLPIGATNVAVFLRGPQGRAAPLLKDFESIINGEGPEGGERVAIPVPPIKFVVPEGFERSLTMPAGALGAWHRATFPAGDLFLRKRPIEDLKGWKPDWPADLVTMTPSEAVVYQGWFDGRMVGFDGKAKPGAPEQTLRAVFLPVGSIAIEIDQRLEGKQWVTVSLDRNGLQISHTPPGTGPGVGICGGCGTGSDSSFGSSATRSDLLIGAAAVVFALWLAWCAWRQRRPLKISAAPGDAGPRMQQ